MPDVLIIRRRNRGYIFAETELGKRWIAENILPSKQTSEVSVAYDLIEEFVRNLEEEELTVEVR